MYKMPVNATMRNTLAEAIDDAKRLNKRYVCQFKGGYKTVNKPSTLGVIVWDARIN